MTLASQTRPQKNVVGVFLVAVPSYDVCVCVTDHPPQTGRAPYGSRVVAALALRLVRLAMARLLAGAKLGERRQTEGGFAPQQLQDLSSRSPPAEPGNASISTLAVRVERLV